MNVRQLVLPAIGWTIIGAALVSLVGWPLLRLVAEAVAAGPGALIAAVGGVGLEATRNSVATSLVATSVAVPAALGLALVTERTSAANRGWLRAAILLPLLVPDFVTAIGWTRAYGSAGLTARVLGVELPGLYGPAGIVLVLGASALPLAYLVIVAGMRVRAEPDLERAARLSGAGALTAFRTVTLPLLLPMIAAAAGLAFITSMNAFGAPAVLGRPAGFATMTTRIYEDLAFSSTDAAFLRVVVLALLLVVVALAVIWPVDRLAPEAASRAGPGTGGSPAASSAPLLAVLAAWSAVLLSVVLPLIALLLTAMTRAVGLPPLPEHLTLDNFGRALDPHAAGALLNSFILAASAASIIVVLGLVAVGMVRGRARGRLGATVILTFALPGSVLAVAVLLAYGGGLRDTLAIILLAYLAKLWALGQRPLSAVSDRLPREVVGAARVHGAGPTTAARTIALPLLAPALVAAWTLVFVFALHEVTISILLHGPGTATLAVVVLNLQQLGDPTVTSALAVLLTGLAAAVFGLLVLAWRIAWPWARVP